MGIRTGSRISLTHSLTERVVPPVVGGSCVHFRGSPRVELVQLHVIPLEEGFDLAIVRCFHPDRRALAEPRKARRVPDSRRRYTRWV